MATEAQDHPNRPSTHLRINAFTHLRAYKAPLHLSRTLYKSTLLMQNKPNFQDVKSM